MTNLIKKTSNRRALTISEAADYACVSRAIIDRWLTEGLLPFEELPGGGMGAYKFKRIRSIDLDSFLEKHYRQTKKVVPIKTQPLKLLPREGNT